MRQNCPFDGTENIKRQPQIGDVGTIVHFGEKGYIVEGVGAEGYSIWLADFSIEELEIYER